jgi:HNH endonuclease
MRRYGLKRRVWGWGEGMATIPVVEPACIWCGKIPASSVEHILPESLGCPEGLILATGVCQRCNNKNGNLDQALLKPFELITVSKGIPRKGGKPPTIDGFSTFSSTHGPDGPQLFFNREKHKVVTPIGKILGPSSKNDEITEFDVEHLGDGKGRLTINVEFRFGRKAVRGLFKIAVEIIAYYHGLDAVRGSEYDEVRAFIRKGKGHFSALLTAGGSFDGYFGPPHCKDDRPYVVGMTILGFGFLCDFDPGFVSGQELEETAHKLGYGTSRIPHAGVS